MYCQNCGTEADEKWSYCPKCGTHLHGREDFVRQGLGEFPDFGSLLEEIMKGIDEMTNVFGKTYDKKDFEKAHHDFRDLFDMPLGVGGVSVRISSTEDKKPQFDIKTFGNLSGHESDLKKWFGMPGMGENLEEEPGIDALTGRKPPKVTEEPKTIINRIDNKLEFRISVPGVMSESDVNIRQLQESIEVRAYKDDKAYFTLFSIPPGSKIRSKRLENEVIILEVEC